MRGVRVRRTKGIAIIIVIVIMTVASIAVIGITALVTGTLSSRTMRASLSSAVYASQAGVYAAINDYNSDQSQPYWDRTASGVRIAGNSYYNYGRDANFLLISAASSERNARTLRNVPLNNINGARSITVDRVSVDWTGFAANNRLNQVWLGGTRRWSGTATSGTPVNLSPSFTMSPGQFAAMRDDNRFILRNNIPAASTIAVTFFFTDGSSRKALLWTNGAGRSNSFSITSTGECRSNFTWKKTVEAVYDVGSRQIISWQESQGHL